MRFAVRYDRFLRRLVPVPRVRAGRFPQCARLSEAVRRAINERTGLDTELSTSGGTSDGRFIAPHGVDVVEVGPINKTIHKTNEEILVEDIPLLTDIYYRIVELLLVEDE